MKPMEPDAEARSILASLSALGTPERAANEKRYLKSEMIHYGVTVPLTRKTALDWCKSHGNATREEIVALVQALWSSGVFEARMACAEILKADHKKLLVEDFGLIEKFLRESQTWALVDNISTGVCDLLYQRHPESGGILDRWATDGDFWLRRAAMLTLLRPLARGGGDFNRFCRYADAMLEEKEFFIRKAIGWVLRDTARKRPEMVAEWLKPRVGRASGLTLREAVRHMPTELKEAIMKG